LWLPTNIYVFATERDKLMGTTVSTPRIKDCLQTSIPREKVRELEKDCKSTYQLKKKRFSSAARALYVSRKKELTTTFLKEHI
jgi:hypothetical protein